MVLHCVSALQPGTLVYVDSAVDLPGFMIYLEYACLIDRQTQLWL